MENNGSKTKKVQDYLVIGLGRFGSSLAMTLHEAGHSVLAIDRDADQVQHFASTLPHVAQMDSTNKEALEEIDVPHFDAAIVCIGSDFESNVLTTVLLRQIGVKRVLAKARTRTQREILEKVGADEVVLPEYDAGVHLARRLISGARVVDFMEISPGTTIVEVEAPDSVVGKKLSESDIRNRYHVTVVAIRRGEEVIAVPHGEEQILAHDILVVLGHHEDCNALAKLQ